MRRNLPKKTALSERDPNQLDAAAAAQLSSHLNARAKARTRCSTILQDMMQDLVGIVRREEEMQRALEELRDLGERAGKVAVTGNREYNGGWHTALDLHNLLTVSEIITRAAIERKESRGAHFRDDYPQKDDTMGAAISSSRETIGRAAS